MKLKYIASALVLAGIASSAAADKTPDQLRVYINPGHGSWTGNDRPMQIIGKPAYSSTNTDTTGFFESNTDLIKGFGMLEKLIEMGMPFDRTLNQEGDLWKIGAAKDLSQNIVMSRVKNGPFEAENTTSSPNYMLYNRALLEIATEVEYNEFDQFVSIHSNAASEGSTVNYHLMMYRGHNGKENVLAPGSWEMAEAASKYSFDNPHAAWSANYTYINGDIDFMSSDKTGSYNSLGYYGYLGVMKHGCPGYLVEGYFHTYQPARHRGMNWDVDQVEGYQYARGVAEYWNFEKRDATGEIYGIVRDKHQKFSHSLYKPSPRTDDLYKPLNGATIILEKDGVKVGEYTTDQFYNGAFVFKGLEPGNYVVTVSHPDYKEADPIEVTVTAGATTYPKAWLEAADYVPEGFVVTDYPDPATGAFGPRDEYKFATEYADQAIEELAGKTIRRTLMRGDLIYILALDAADEPTIIVYNAKTKAVVANVSTEGMTTTYQIKCSDIQLTADGVLLACNKDTNLYSSEQATEEYPTRGTWRLYRWENDANGLPAGAPVQHYTCQATGLWYRAHVGDTFAYTGTLTEGKLAVSAETISTGGALRMMGVSFMEGATPMQTDHKFNTSANAVATALGEGYRFVTSPNDTDHFLVFGPGSAEVLEYEFTHADGAAPIASMPKGIIEPAATLAGVFRYAGHSYIASAVTEGDACASIQLTDITDGVAYATPVSVVNTALTPAADTDADTDAQPATTGSISQAANYAIVAAPQAIYDEMDAVKGIYIDLAHIAPTGVTKLTTNGVEQAKTRAHFPYNLDMATNEGEYTFTFDVTGDVKDAEIVLTSVDDPKATVVIPVGPVTAAEGASVLYDASELDGQYTWAVRVTSPAVADAAAYEVENSIRKGDGRGGVVVINDPEQASYGMTVVTQGYAQGFDIYNQQGTRTSANIHSGAPFVSAKINSAIRGGEYQGKAVVIDWCDANAGLFVIDPLNPETAPWQFFSGTRDGIGAFILDGKAIGGGGSGVAFQKHADGSTSMYTCEEDLSLATRNNDMIVVRYDLAPGAETIAEGPASDFGQKFSRTSYLTGTNVEIKTWADGFLMAQGRAAGNNVEKEPAFIFADNDGNIILNSGTLEDITSCNSAVALTTDLKTMAVGTYDGIRIYSVTWKDGKPALTFKYQIPGTAADWAQYCFDPAGNLHAYTLNKGYQMYTLTNAAPQAVTPAKASMLVGTTGIMTIDADRAAQGPEVYYNLQGVRVDSDHLTPGIYVRTAGSKAEKVVIR